MLVSYVIACQQYTDAAKADLVKALRRLRRERRGQQAAAQQAGSAPLSKDLAAKVTAAIATIK